MSEPEIAGHYTGFDVTVDDAGVLVLTFNRPEKLNGLGLATKRDLIALFEQIQYDPRVRVAVLTGTGRAFCAGDDITGGYTTDTVEIAPEVAAPNHTPISAYTTLRMASQRVNAALRALDKPTIACLNGIAIQSGLSLALACDLKVAARSARLGSATLRFGFLPDEGGHHLLLEHVGLAKTLELLLRKRIVAADEALALGMVNEVVDDDQALPTAMAWATEMAAGPQIATRLLKRAVYNAAAAATFEASCEDIAVRAMVSDNSPDGREGFASFREKRPAKFE